MEDSGLLDRLVRAYHAAQNQFRVLPTARGSGAALALGRRGDADLLLTHDPPAESAFVAAGHADRRAPVMESEFVLAGPGDDPAGIRGARDFPQALARIARSRAPFISRGDDSGTHHRELALWHEAGIPPPERQDWYRQAGAGMAETLRIAAQRDAYVLTDLPTLVQLRRNVPLEILASGDPPVRNPYSYMVPASSGNPEGARHFAKWLIGPGQRVIATHGGDRPGARLFEPTARQQSSTSR